RARQHGYTLGFQEAPGERFAVGIDLRYVEHHVHAALRAANGDTVEASYRVEERLAAHIVSRGDFGNAVAVLDRRYGRSRDEIGHAVTGNQIEADQIADDLGRRGEPADPPARHAMAFGQRIDDQRTLLHARQG